MSELYAQVLRNGHKYRVEGISHDASGSRLRYNTVDDLEKALHAKLEECKRLDGASGEEAPCWVGIRGEDRFRVEARSVGG